MDVLMEHILVTSLTAAKRFMPLKDTAGVVGKYKTSAGLCQDVFGSRGIRKKIACVGKALCGAYR